MLEKIELTKKLNLVKMYDADISSEEMPIIGTDALGPCVGVLLYNEVKKQAIVAHAAPDKITIALDIMKLVCDNEWDLSDIKYHVFQGYYKDHYNTKERLEEALHFLTAYKKTEIPENAILVDEKDTCHSFAFDSRNGEFVTDKVLFGYEYYKIHQELSTKKKK